MDLPINMSKDLETQLSLKITNHFQESVINEDLLEQLVNCNDISLLHLMLTQIRREISCENPPIEEAINAKIIPFLIEVIERNITNQISYEASWALSNIASGTQTETQKLVQFGGIDLFLELLNSDYQPLIEQAVWGLCNISADCLKLRDQLLMQNIFQKIIEINQKLDDKKNLIWLINVLTQPPRLPEPYLFHQYQLIPILANYIVNYSQANVCEKETLVYAIMSLSYITEQEQSYDEIINFNGLLKVLSQMIVSQRNYIRIPAIRIIGNLTTGNDQQTQQILNIGCQKIMLDLLKEGQNKHIMKEVLWTISNICAGNQQQVSAILHESDMMKVIFQIVEQNISKDIVTEALYILSNSLISVSVIDAQFLVDAGLLKLFTNHIQQKNNLKQATIILEGLLELFKKNIQNINDQLAQLFQEDQQWIQPLLQAYPCLTEKTKYLIKNLNEKKNINLN